MQFLNYVYVLFHIVNGISLYTVSGVVNTANIECSSVKWSLTRGQKQRKTIKPCSQKVVAIVYKERIIRKVMGGGGRIFEPQEFFFLKCFP